MALEGNVKDFGLSEIFQLIAIQKKSGMLSVSGEDNMVVFFRDGAITSTRDRRNRTRDPLKDFLLRYGFIDRDEMNNLQRIQMETNLDLTDILVSEKYFSEDELTMIFTEQIQETIQEIMSWPKSYYKFISGKQVLHGVKSFSALKVEGVLMESMRRIDEFPELKRIFTSEEIVLRNTAMPKNNPPSLDTHEEFLYELLEMETTLSELVSRARMARFCTYEGLKGLLEKGLLQIVRDSKPTDERATKEIVPTQKSERRKLAPTFATVLLLLGSYAIGEYIVPAVFPPGWSARSRLHGLPPEEGTPHTARAGVEAFMLRQLEASIRGGLEQYRAERGCYPFSLEILAVQKYVPEILIDRAHYSNMRYRIGKNGASYVIERS